MAVEMMLAGDLKQDSPLDAQSSRLVYGYIQPGNKVAFVRHILRFLSAYSSCPSVPLALGVDL